MAQLGSARTKAWNIGTAELRVTPLSSSGKALQAHSVGLVDGVTFESAQESARLEGSFPRKLIDTAIISQTASVRGTLREYSRRNLNVLLGLGVPSGSQTDVATTMSGSATIAGATSFDVTSAAGISAGDTLVVFPRGKPELLSVVIVASIATNTLTLNAKTPLLVAYDPANPVDVFNAHPIPLGAVAETKYFGVQVVQRNPVSGRPRIIDLWKGAISSGMTLETGNQDYGSTELAIEAMEPSADDYAVGGPLEHLSDIIPVHPTGRMAWGADI